MDLDLVCWEGEKHIEAQGQNENRHAPTYK